MKKFILVMALLFVSSAARAESNCTEELAQKNVELFLDLVIESATQRFKVLESKSKVSHTQSTAEEFVVLYSRRAVKISNGTTDGDVLTSLGIASVSRADCQVDSVEF